MKLRLLAVNGGPFKCAPAMEIDLKDKRILCNNVILPWEFNPHKVRLFVIGNEFGAVGAVWADCEWANLDYAWIRECELKGEVELLCAFAEARGACQTTLDK